MKEPIISVSGLRGIVGESLRPEVVARYVSAFAAEIPPGAVLLSRDSRASGPMIAGIAASVLRAAGRNVLNAGIAATPTTGVLIKSLNAAGGVQISASHNPAEYNGLKLFSADGRVFTAAAGEAVLERYRNDQSSWDDVSSSGDSTTLDDPHAEHLRLVLATVDVQRIRQRRFRVVLDSNHGAGGILGRRLLDALGCQATYLGDEPTGQFVHQPEPTAENLATICEQVANANADIGFCQDPDADRLAVIDETGRYVGEEYTLALCVAHVLNKHKGAVVTNISTSRMVEDIAARYGVPFFRSQVGEANVVDCMLEHKAVFGGEGNGGPIDPRVGYVRDSFVGMALILDAMAARGQPVSQLCDELPQYAIHKTKVPLAVTRLDNALEALEQHFRDAESNRVDGLRLDWNDKWLLIRASNTEPIVRVIAEAATKQDAAVLCEEAAQVVSKLG